MSYTNLLMNQKRFSEDTKNNFSVLSMFFPEDTDMQHFSSSVILSKLYSGELTSLEDITKQNMWLPEYTPSGEGAEGGNEQRINIFQELSKTAQHYIVKKHSKCYVRTELFPEWQQLRVETTTLPILIAAESAYHRKISGRKTMLEPLIARHKKYAFPRGLCETHLHMGAYTYPEEQWLTALHTIFNSTQSISKILGHESSQSDEKVLVRRGRYLLHQLKTALFIRTNIVNAFRLGAEEKIRQTIKQTFSEVDIGIQTYNHLSSYLSSSDNCLNSLWESEVFLWEQAFSFSIQQKASSEELTVLLHLYLLIENNFLTLFRGERNIRGLENFRNVYKANLDIPKEPGYHQRVCHRLKKDTHFSNASEVEVRLSISEFQKKSKEIQAYWKHISGSENSLRQTIHLIKSNRKRKRVMTKHEMMKETRKRSSKISEYIRTEYLQSLGLDAAGATLQVPPESFAPTYRYLASGITKRTFHCGEDFHHLVSGIREVADTVQFLELKTGDCISHAISIGIEPQKWISEQNPTITIPRREWFLNLLYLLEATQKGFTQQIGNRHITLPTKQWQIDALQLARSIFRQEISENELPLLQQLYHNRHLYAPYINSEEAEASASCPASEYEAMLIRQNCGEAGSRLRQLLYIWNNEHTEDEENLINIQRDYIPAEIIVALQQQVQRTLKEKGIIIEVCLVSNYRISVYNALEEHHIMRWLKLRGCYFPGDIKMKLCLGSDDPGIFSTNTANEYYLLICLLLRKGLKHKSVYRIINELILTGNLAVRGNSIPHRL